MLAQVAILSLKEYKRITVTIKKKIKIIFEINFYCY